MEERIKYDTWWANKQNVLASDKETHAMSIRQQEEQEAPALVIPENVTEVTIRRLRYTDGSLTLTVKGDEWGMNVITTDAELLERITIIANAMKELE